MGMPPSIKWLLKFFIVISSFAIVLAGIEMMMKVFWPQRDVFLYRYQNGYLYNLPDFDNLFSPLPRGYADKMRRKVFVRRVKTNSKGQRDDREHSYERGGDQTRILNLGDSIGFGWPGDLKDSYIKMLEEVLAAETINCSVIGVNTPHLLEIYEKDCKRYEADVVVFQMTVTKGRWRPDYLFFDKLGPDYAEITALLQAGRTDYLRKYVIKDEQHAAMWLDGEDGGSGYRDILRKQTTPRFPFYHRFNIVRFAENSMMRVNRVVRLNELGEILGVPLMGRNPAPTLYYLTKLKASVERQGAKLVVILVPNLDGYRFLKDGRRMDLDILLAFLKSNDYQFLNFMEVFRNYSPEEIYIMEELHPNEKGYRIIGEKLAGFIRDNILACTSPHEWKE